MADPTEALKNLPPMTDLTMDNITRNVLLMNSTCSNLRLKFILERIVVHLHDFVRETRLTAKELMTGLNFLAETGKSSDEEFIMLADILGMSTLVDSIECPKPPGATDGTVLGPFHTHEVEDMAVGSLLSSDANGKPMLILCTVKDNCGKPIPGVKVHIWESDSTGHYDMQYPDRDDPDGRCAMQSDENGFFWLRAILPPAYPIPSSGPAGQLMKKLGRHCWRPAHVHFMFEKPGYDQLITALFFHHDPYTATDPVFGIKRSLMVNVGKVDKQMSRMYGVKEGIALMEYNFVLVSEQEASQLRTEQTKVAFDKLGLRVKIVEGLPVPDVD